MEKEKLRYLQIVAEEGNLTKAAKRLYISQPALTACINKLEKKYGVKFLSESQNQYILLMLENVFWLWDSRF